MTDATRSLAPGLRADVTHVVTDADTAIALGSGDVAVYGTPALVALLERAAVAAVAGALIEGQTSVGARIEVDHLAPTRAGATVRATAELIEVEGRRLLFRCEAFEGTTLIGRAEHRRAIVDRARFD